MWQEWMNQSVARHTHENSPCEPAPINTHTHTHASARAQWASDAWDRCIVHLAAGLQQNGSDTKGKERKRYIKCVCVLGVFVGVIALFINHLLLTEEKGKTNVTHAQTRNMLLRADTIVLDRIWIDRSFQSRGSSYNHVFSHSVICQSAIMCNYSFSSPAVVNNRELWLCLTPPQRARKSLRK